MILGATIVLLAAAAGISPADAEPDTLRYVAHMAGAPIGSHTSITLTDAGGRITRREDLTLRIARGTREIRVEEHAVWVENASGRLLRFEVVRTGLGPSRWADTVERISGGWRRVRDRGGSAAIDTLPEIELTGPAGLDHILATSIDSVCFHDIDPVDLVPRSVTARYLRGDTIGRGDISVACNVFALIDSASGEEVLQWRDRDGEIWKEEDVRLGWVMERECLADLPDVGVFDALEWGRIEVSGTVPPAPPCEILLLPLRLALSTPASPLALRSPPIPGGPGQTVVPGPTEGSWRVRIDPPPAPSSTNEDREGWRGDAALLGALRPGLIVDADDPGIRQFAETATAGARNPTEEALLLERAVHKAIRILDLGTAFATASQTLRDRRGDCTEHAVLLAACCRARGIPSRLVAGLVPSEERMLFHLWTEVYLGEWVGLDATLGLGRAAICGLTLLRWEQPEDGIAEFNQSVANLVGQFHFEIGPSR